MKRYEEVARVKAISDSGNVHYIVELVVLVRIGENSDHTSLWAQTNRILRTSDGYVVQRKEDETYVVVSTGEALKRV